MRDGKLEVRAVECKAWKSQSAVDLGVLPLIVDLFERTRLRWRASEVDFLELSALDGNCDVELMMLTIPEGVVKLGILVLHQHDRENSRSVTTALENLVRLPVRA